MDATYKGRLNMGEARELIPMLAVEAGLDAGALESRLRQLRMAHRREQIASLTRAGVPTASTQLAQHQRALERLERQETRYQAGLKSGRAGRTER